MSWIARALVGIKNYSSQIVLGVVTSLSTALVITSGSLVYTWVGEKPKISTAWVPLPFLSAEACSKELSVWLEKKQFTISGDWRTLQYDAHSNETEGLQYSEVRDKVAEFVRGDFSVQARCVQSILPISYGLLSASTLDASGWQKLEQDIWKDIKDKVWSINASPSFGGKSDIHSWRDHLRYAVTLNIPSDKLPRARAEGTFKSFLIEYFRSKGFEDQDCSATSCSFIKQNVAIWVIFSETDIKSVVETATPQITLEVIGTADSYDRRKQWLFYQVDFTTLLWEIPGAQNVLLLQKDWVD